MHLTKVTEFLDHNDNDKEGDRKSSPVVSRLLEEKEDIILKIDRACKHASLLNKERLELTQTLSTIRKEVECGDS